MLDDIANLTDKVLDEALASEKKLRSPKTVYDFYRALCSVIDNARLVANHYLVLDLTESFLQHSSFGEPIEKWRYVLNEDLEKLDKSSKRYLIKLSYLSFEDANQSYLEGILSKYYNHKTYYGFVQTQYSVGHVEPCSSILYCKTLDYTVQSEDISYIGKFYKLDLSLYESKQQLQQKILDNVKRLQAKQEKLKSYILEKYSLQDLL